MAKQIKFYSTSLTSYTALGSSTDANGVFFVDNGELYKGTQRFGLGRVTIASDTTGVTDMERGDIVVTGSGAGWVYDGISSWQKIGGDISSLTTSWRADISDWISGLVYTSGGAAKDTFILGITKDANGKLTAQTADLAKASVGDSTTTAQHGISAKVTLNRTAKPNLEMTVNAVTTAPGITSAADYFTTGSAIYNYANGLVAGTSATSYIAAVTRDATTGKLTAHAKAFPEIPTVAGGQSVAEAWKDGPYVHVVIESATAKPEVYIGEFGSAAAKGVVTSSGSFKTATTIDYSNMLPTASAVAAYVDGNVTTLNNATNTKASKGTGSASASYGVSGTFTLKSNSGTHDFTLYVNPITASANINSETSLPTGKAVKDYVDAKISNLGTVMHFKGAGTTLPASPSVGDVYVFTADSGNYKKGQEVVYTASGWEVLGDQNQWVDKVTGGSKTVTDSATNIALTVGTEAVTASVTTLSFSGFGTAASKNFTTEIAGGGYGASGTASNDNLPTEAAVVTYVENVVNGNIPKNGSSSASSNGVTIGASTTAGELTDTSITITPAALNANLNASTYLVTGSTMYNHTSGLAAGGNASYIQKIAYANGKLTATAVAFPSYDYNPTASTSTSTSNGTTVSVTTQNGKVTKVEVAASNWTPGTSTESGTSNNIKVDVTTTSGVVTAVAVSSPFIATEVTKSGTSNGHTVSVTTKNGQVTAVAVAAPAVAAATTKTSASKGVQVSVTGHITAVSVVTTLSTTLGADAEHAPTTKAVYEAMCWYSSDGSLIP